MSFGSIISDAARGRRTPADRHTGLVGVKALVVLTLLTTAVGSSACTPPPSRGPTGGGTTGGGTTGRAAPAIDLPLLGGGRLTNASLMGKPTLLSFSATW